MFILNDIFYRNEVEKLLLFFYKLIILILYCLQVSRPLLDKTFHKKVQSRKIFTHRESFDTIIAKTEEKLLKVS